MNENKKVNGLGIAGLVCGLVGLVIFGYICGIIAIIFGIVCLTSGKKDGFSIASLVLGCIDVGLLLIMQLAGL